MSAAGPTVTLSVTGWRRDLPAAVDLAAYRVVQEALTNVLRHAGTPAARVEIGYQPGELAIRVSDTGTGPPDGARMSPGLGLPGMSARVTALGGVFAADPDDPTGFLVSARFPLPQPDRPGQAREPARQVST